MKKYLLAFGLGLVATVASAKLKVSNNPSGGIVLTVEVTNDLSNEFVAGSGYLEYHPTSLLAPYVNETKIKVVTTNGAKLSSNDIYRLCGFSEEENNFKYVNTLDLEEADLSNDADLVKLSFMDNLKTITFPKSTTTIPGSCLINNSCKIEHVIVPNNRSRSLTIETQAFAAQTLKTVVLGEVQSGNLGLQVFLNCTSLTTVDYHYGWTEIGSQAFMNCSALTTVVLPEGLKTIKDGAFSGSAISAIRLPSTLETIEQNAFNAEYLKTITIPASVKYIAAQAFQNNRSLTDVYVLGTDTKIDEQGFSPANTYNMQNVATSGKQTLREYFTSYSNIDNVVTVLHYPAAAKNKYLNSDILTHNMAGATYVVDAKGNYANTETHGLYNAKTGDYAGWQNFMLTQELVAEEVYNDDKRVGDKWYSLCLPFSMTKEQIESAYGAGTEVVEFIGVDINTNATTNEKTIHFNFTKKVTATKAHHPYMIHPGIRTNSSLTGIVSSIAGVVKEAETETALNNEKQTITGTDGVKYTFIGNYTSGKEIPAPAYYYYSGPTTQYANGFYKRTKKGGNWNKYTAIIVLDRDNGIRTSPSIIFNLSGFNSLVTGIDTLEMMYNTTTNNTLNNSKVYNTNGIVVLDGVEKLNSLPAGVYIVNGKKYVVKK